MKRKLVLGLVALGGGLTVVGSGFASWYFGASDITGAAAVGYHTTDVNNGIGSLAATYTLNGESAAATELGTGDKLYLCLDQGLYANKDDATCGISFHKLTSATTSPKDADFSSATLVSKLGVKYTLPKENLITLQNAGATKATLTATFTLNTSYLTINSDASTASYVKSTATDSTATGNITSGVLKYTVTFDFSSAETTSDYTASFDFDVSTTDYAKSSKNKMISYATDKKPTTSDSYSAMTSELKTELTDAGKNALDVTYSLNVGAASTTGA